MKVCIDARMIDSSGIGTIIQNFLVSFSGEFQLIVLGNENKLQSFLASKSNYRIIKLDAPIYSLKEQFYLARLIPACDIFWSPHYNIPLLPIKAKKRVVNINDVFHLAFAHTVRWHQRKYAHFVINQAVRRSDKLITISKFSEAEIIRHAGHFDKSKLAIIYCGVDNNLFRRVDGKEALDKVRTKYNLPRKYVLFVGNVKPHKNLRTLVKAMALLKDKNENCKLVIVGRKEGFINGDPQLFDEIGKDQFLLDNIGFTGFVPNEDLAYIYNLASVFVFPSFYEGFGLPPLEAMACGCPVLASNAASIPEICGESARYFDPSSSIEIANGILDCLSDGKHSDFIEKGLAHVKSFSWEESYREQILVFNSLLKEHK